VILQQDAFDAVDSVCPLERQDYMLKKIIDICRADFKFDNFNEVSEYFKRLINLFKQMNYSEFKSDNFYDFGKQVDALVQERVI